jgi:hypothetical protein
MERLQVDDSYDDAIDPKFKRPQPVSKEKEIANLGKQGEDLGTTLLYVESGNNSTNSAIRMDDIDVFLRVDTYR